MSQPISLFSAYTQRENQVTNYCGLLMKLVYEESPQQFQRLLETLLPDAQGLVIGPRFSQQRKVKSSVPDLVVEQQPFRIAFETKNHDWFYDDQIERHLDGLGDANGTTVLILLANFEVADYARRFAKAIVLAKERDVLLVPLSFEDFAAAFSGLALSAQLQATVEEFEVYLDRKGLLPTWKYLLDVVNCATMSYEVEGGSYMCPDTGGAYRHRRARWLGMYAAKTVSRVYPIEAVVAIGAEGTELRWNNGTLPKTVLFARAQAQIDRYDYRQAQVAAHGVQVFLLGEGADTDFRKTSSGGLMGSKKYFYGVDEEGDTVEVLAARLREERWG